MEDLTQATFERALRAWARFDPSRASARTWLLAIARKLLVDHIRRRASDQHEPIPDGEVAIAAIGLAGGWRDLSAIMDDLRMCGYAHPIILGISLLAAIAMVLRRRRPAHPS